jgi:hypothetical protein
MSTTQRKFELFSGECDGRKFGQADGGVFMKIVSVRLAGTSTNFFGYPDYLVGVLHYDHNL